MSMRIRSCLRWPISCEWYTSGRPSSTISGSWRRIKSKESAIALRCVLCVRINDLLKAPNCYWLHFVWHWPRNPWNSRHTCTLPWPCYVPTSIVLGLLFRIKMDSISKFKNKSNIDLHSAYFKPEFFPSI